MSETRASRRQVLAAIALADELPMPREISFTNDSFTLYLDTVAELHKWLPYFDMTEKTVAVQPYTHGGGPEAGQTTTLANAYSGQDCRWRGWPVHLNALDPVGEPQSALDAETRAQLLIVNGDDS